MNGAGRWRKRPLVVVREVVQQKAGRALATYVGTPTRWDAEVEEVVRQNEQWQNPAKTGLVSADWVYENSTEAQLQVPVYMVVAAMILVGKKVNFYLPRPRITW